MRWLSRLFGRGDVEDEKVAERLHCIRFTTDRGEQVAVLLTTEEFERGMLRWVETIDRMPIETIGNDSDEGLD